MGSRVKVRARARVWMRSGVRIMVSARVWVRNASLVGSDPKLGPMWAC